jgi:hypothetical protein
MRMHGVQVVGDTLTLPLDRADGYVTQVFEGVVARVPTGQRDMELMPIARLLGMKEMEPGHQKYGLEDGVVFYNIGDGALGYHVPIEFDAFIDSHGGRQKSGDPIAEVLFYEDGAIRQCFENYCLDYNTDPSMQRVSLYPLGARYLRRALKEGWVDPATVLPGFITLDDVHIVLAEQQPEVSSDETQVIHIGVFSGDENLAVPDVNVRLKLTMPDGKSREFDPLRTNANGQVVVEISGLDLPNGSLVVYQACLEELIGDVPVCAADAYIIWDTDT